MEDKHDYSSVFAAIQDAADSFQKLNGPINETTDFCLYYQFLCSAIIEFNVKNNCSYTPEVVLEKWGEEVEKELESFMENEDMRFMNEALKNWDNLKKTQS
ncbi:TPA: hypothetical protein ACHVTL_005420 [Klebsiella pneumoniae]